MEIGSEQRRFVTARACPDLDDAVSFVERVARQQERRDFRLEFRDGDLETPELRARFGGHLGVVNGNELAHLRELVFGPVKSGGHLDDRHQPAVLSPQLRELIGVAECAWIGERALDLFGACEGGR
jgi:hypothetical protein